MSGADWANAAPITSLNAMVQKAGPGGTVLLNADEGPYNLVKGSIGISYGGADGQPVTIKGVDSAGNDKAAVFSGTRPTDDTAASTPGNQAFVLKAGADNLVFENMDIRNVQNAFRAAADVSNVEIGHIQASNVQRFFDNYHSWPATTATVSGLDIHDVDVTGYSKGVIRVGYDSHDVKITNVTGDSAGQNFDYFAIGLHITGTAHDIVVDHVTMQNNRNYEGTYWNGDGFTTEAKTYNITFVDTLSKGNMDGGYDLKSTHTTLIRAVAEENGRNYRFWGTDNVMIDSVGLDPQQRNGSINSQVWVHGGAELKIIDSQFIDSGLKTKVFNFDDMATIDLDNVYVTYAEGAILKFGTGELNGLDMNDVQIVAPTGNYSSGHTASFPVAEEPAPVPEPIESAQPPAPDPAPAPEPVQPSEPAIDPVPDPVTHPTDVIAAGPANEVLMGTATADTFFFDTASGASFGTDTIRNFGAEDRLVTTTAIFDSNHDGKISANASDRFTLPAEIGDSGASGTVKIFSTTEKAVSSIYLVDTVVENGVTHFVYGTPAPTNPQPSRIAEATTAGEAAVAADGHTPIGSIQSTSANEHFKATSAKDLFFFDTARGESLGTDAISGFGAGDRIVTTSAFYDNNDDGRIGFNSSDRINLPGATSDDAASISGTLKLFNSNGKAVSSITHVDTVVDHGVTYYVYGATGDTTGGADLLF